MNLTLHLPPVDVKIWEAPFREDLPEALVIRNNNNHSFQFVLLHTENDLQTRNEQPEIIKNNYL